MQVVGPAVQRADDVAARVAAAAQHHRLAMAADVGDQLDAARACAPARGPRLPAAARGSRRPRAPPARGRRSAGRAEQLARLAPEQVGVEVRRDRQLRAAAREGVERQAQVGHDFQALQKPLKDRSRPPPRRGSAARPDGRPACPRATAGAGAAAPRRRLGKRGAILPRQAAGPLRTGLRRAGPPEGDAPDYNRRFARRNADSTRPPPRLAPPDADAPASYEQALAELERLVPTWKPASCRSIGCSKATGAAPSCSPSAAAARGGRESRSRCSKTGSSSHGSNREGCRVRPLGARRRPRPSSGARALGAARRAGRARPGDALRRARRRQARAAAAGAGGGAGGRPRSRHGRRRCGAARRGRGRADPRLFAGPRRHAVHGQRRAAPRQADRARAVRRGAGDARRRRDAGAGVRGAHARRAGVAPALQARLCALLARAAGHAGMAGGQAIDLASIGLPLDEHCAARHAPAQDRRAAAGQRADGRGLRRRRPARRAARWPTTATPSAWRSRSSTTSST